jgi:hypothetical protein
MWTPFRKPFRISRIQAIDAKQIDQMREVIAQSEKLLSNNPIPDTFVGRKTQEPFAAEDEEPQINGWLDSKELQPPK